jgi:hypothetical protein
MKRKPTIEDARKAVQTLQAYGRTRFCKTSNPSSGQCIGLAVSACTDSVVDAAMEMLEDWNYHLAVAAIAAIQQGQGRVERKGRRLTIVLPEHWADR